MYPGLEKENLGGGANGGAAAAPHQGAWPAPARTPASSPLTARQARPGTSAWHAGGSTRYAGAPSARGLFGSCPAPPSSPSGFTDAGAAEPTLSGLHPADSADPTVQGPAPKRARRAAVSWSLPAGTGASAVDSDSDGEDAVVSRRRPTPGKPPAAARVVAQHPPPTWGASAGGAASTHQGAASPIWAQRQQQQRPAAAAAAAAEDEDEWCGSDMEEDGDMAWADWQPHRLPLYDEPEE